MIEEKEFKSTALASLTTGIVLENFSEMHEAAEYIMGHPIWTHQFPILADKIKEAIIKQFPEMPIKISDKGFETTRDEVIHKFGVMIKVKKGKEQGIHPLDPEGFPKALKDKM